MLGLAEPTQNLGGGRTIVERTNSVLPTIAQRAASTDESDTFVGENYALLKESGLARAGVPIELGGLGAEVPELSEMLKSIARACGSTALAFSMHTHQVAIPAWRWRHQKVAAVEPLLRRVASEQIILLSSGGSDWIGGSGKAIKVDKVQAQVPRADNIRKLQHRRQPHRAVERAPSRRSEAATMRTR